MSTPFTIQKDTSNKISRETRDIEICLAYQTIEDGRKKREWLNSIVSIYWPFYVLPLDQSRGILLDGVGLASSKISVSPITKIQTTDLQSASDTPSFIRIAEKIIANVLNNYKMPSKKEDVEFLPDSSFLTESKSFFSLADSNEVDEEFVITPTKRIDSNFLNRTALQFLPSDIVFEKEKNVFQNITNELNKQTKNVREKLQNIHKKHQAEKERLIKAKEGELRERTKVKEDELKLLEEKLAKGYPGAFPEPPDFKDHLSRLSSSFDQIRQTGSRKLVGESEIAIKGSETASQVLIDDLRGYKKRIDTYQTEANQFERDNLRETESAKRRYVNDMREIEDKYAGLEAELAEELEETRRDEAILIELKTKLREGYDKWLSTQKAILEELDSQTIRLDSPGRDKETLNTIYFPFYLVEYSSTKKVRYSLVAPHLIDLSKKHLVDKPTPFNTLASAVEKHLERRFTSWGDKEVLKRKNQLRIADIQEAFERGLRVAERRNLIAAKPSRVLGEKYYRNFVPE